MREPTRGFRAVCVAAWLILAFAPSIAGAGGSGPDLIHKDGFEDTFAFPANDADAARFLQQTTFGPLTADIQHVRQIGYSAWIDEQFALPMSLETRYLDWIASLGETVYHPARLEAWFLHVIGGPDPANALVIHRDQLRQRVAFALSEILVISDVNEGISTIGATSYYDTLIRDAFGNYRQLLGDVTLHPAMGIYLSMLMNRKPDPILNIRPDENYAREIMQLFSVGLAQLNPDGTLVLQSGVPVPTYTQETVRGFASVFTGWNWAGCDGWTFCYPGSAGPPADAGWYLPLEPIESYHDQVGPDVDSGGQHYKQLLNYPGAALPQGRLLAGGLAAPEMQIALDNVFNHPNVGPFIVKQLIQRLVTSNPSPSYVQRVAAVFNNNGQGVRGDLKAVIKALLLDAEARNGHVTMPATFGKAREPLLRFVQLLRTTNSHAVNGRFNLPYPDFDYSQAPLRAPSVFNFFKPDFHPTGEVAQLGLVAPEFQIMNDAQLTKQTNDIGHRLVYGRTNGTIGATNILINVDTDEALAANPAQLVDKYNLLFMAGQMSTGMRTALINHLNTIAAGNATGRRNRVTDALYLILNSPEYLIQK